MELVQGCRNKRELELLKQDLLGRAAELVPVTPQISEHAISLVEAYALANGLKMADALIAATAMASGLTLLTANAKHFRCIEGLATAPFVP